MIQVYFDGYDTVVTGEIEEGDIYPDICCAGNNWKVAVIFPFADGGKSIWGHCENPECTKNERDWMYGGVGNYDGAEFEVRVGEATR